MKNPWFVSVLAAALMAAALPAGAQPPLCNAYTFIGGWNERVDVQNIYGFTNGPEDVAYDAVTGHIFVAHDAPNMTPDVIVEYDVNGNFIQSTQNLPGVGGLCWYPATGRLLVTNGATIIEVDATGVAVPGGLNLAVTLNGGWYGNIQDLDFDALGNLWVHNGDNGNYAIVDVTTGAATTQFVGMGSQSLTIRGDNGNILGCRTFFGPGTAAYGTILEYTPAGVLVCQGLSGTTAYLHADQVCTAFTMASVNGMAWASNIGGGALIVDTFGLPGGLWNVLKFTPATYGSVTPYIQANAAACPPVATVTGFPRVGTSGFVLNLSNALPGETAILALSLAADCTGQTFGTNCILGVDILPPNLVLPDPVTGFGLFGIPGSGSVSFGADFTGVTGPLGFSFYVQWGATDPGAPGGIHMTRAFRFTIGL